MPNPGSCKPKDGFVITKEEKEFPCNISGDETIANIIQLCQESYNNELSGYVFIVNLSDKRETKSKESINKLKEIKEKVSNQLSELEQIQ